MAHLDTTTTQHSLPLRGTFYHLYQSHGKRLFDLLFALTLLPILAPIIAILCLCVRCQGGCALFAHTRIGQDGVPFACWKLCTMVPDAEARLADLLASDPAAATEWAKTQKLHNDPRVTRLGRFLRRTSLDELPQIWNVLRNEM
jgi:exopolysaccharide production protein ExoY